MPSFYSIFSAAQLQPEIPTTNVEQPADNEAEESRLGQEREADEAQAAAATEGPAVQSERETFRFSPTPYIHNLPGPSQVVTHPGNSGTNSNGQRQRRRGVSGPPTGRRNKLN